MKLKVLSIILTSVAPTILWAQTQDTLKSDEINVVRAFEPQVNLVNKVDFPPNLPKISTTNQPIVQQYTFNDYFSSLNYKPEDLKPVKYTPPTSGNESIGYVKAGFGNILTPVFKLGLANKDQSKFRTGLNVDFIHSKAKKAFQQYYELGIEGYGEYHLENLTIGAKASLDLDQYYLYGMSEEEALTIGDKKDISRKFTIPRFGLYFFNHSTNRWDMNFAGNFDVEIAKTDFNNQGYNINYDLHAFREFKGDTYKVGLDIDGQFTSNTNPIETHNRKALAIKPYGGIKMGIWSLTAGPVLIVDDGDVFLLPYITNQIKVKDDVFVIYNEWKSSIGYDNMIRIHRENPFIANSIHYHDYRFQERTILGVRGALPIGVSYDVRFGNNAWSNVPLFVNDTNDFKQFEQVHDEKMTAWVGHAEVGYEKPKEYGGKVAFDYNSYSTTHQAAAWHMPEFKFSLAGNYTWDEKLNIMAEVITLGGIKVRNPQLVVEKLSPQVDINLAANYQLNKNIGFFVELNNLLNNKQARWNQYDRFGFQGIGGVKIIF